MDPLQSLSTEFVLKHFVVFEAQECFIYSVNIISLYQNCSWILFFYMVTKTCVTKENLFMYITKHIGDAHTGYEFPCQIESFLFLQIVSLALKDL